MAVETKAPPEIHETQVPESSGDVEQTRLKQAKSGPGGRYGSILRRLSRHGLVIALAVSLIANGVALAKLGSSRDMAAGHRTPEVGLGQFSFISSRAEADQVVEAKFTLHVALSEDTEKQGRRRLNQRQFRLRQDMEELLRGAYSGDFDDPLLRELKQKLKERINKTLGIPAAAYVIITGLETERSASFPVEKEEPAGLVPWAE